MWIVVCVVYVCNVCLFLCICTVYIFICMWYMCGVWHGVSVQMHVCDDVYLWHMCFGMCVVYVYMCVCHECAVNVYMYFW